MKYRIAIVAAYSAGVCSGALFIMIYLQPLKIPTQPDTLFASDPRAEASERQLIEVTRELEDYKHRLALAAKELQGLQTKERNALPPSSDVGNHSMPSHSDTPSRDNAVKWKISAIEKFVPLSEDQKERIERSFLAKRGGEEGETLDDILGQESAKYYRDQVQNAFRRMQQQELEKEVLLTSRRLALSTEQERSLRIIFDAIEVEIDSSGGSATGSPQERVASMVEENKKRIVLRAARVKEILSPSQFAEFVKQQAESPEADMEIFHDAGGQSERE